MSYSWAHYRSIHKNIGDIDIAALLGRLVAGAPRRPATLALGQRRNCLAALGMSRNDDGEQIRRILLERLVSADDVQVFARMGAGGQEDWPPLGLLFQTLQLARIRWRGGAIHLEIADGPYVGCAKSVELASGFLVMRQHQIEMAE